MNSLRTAPVRAAAAAAIACALLPASASAQGFGVYEQGACMMGRGNTGVAAPCDDGSAIYVNPAGIIDDGLVVSGGATLVFGSGSFTSDEGLRTGTDNGTAAAPHGYLSVGVGDRLALGVGVYAPYGLSMRWPLGFAGRFVSYDSELRALYVQPTAAVALTPRVSIGAGLTVVRSSVELNRREDLASIPIVEPFTFGVFVNDGTDFLDTSFSASGATGVGVNLGVTAALTDQVRVGAHYLSRVSLDYDGAVRFAPIAGATYDVEKPNPFEVPVGTPIDLPVAMAQAAFTDQDARTALTMPAQFSAGLSVRLANGLHLLADYQWVEWSVFDTVTLDFTGPIPPDEQLVQSYRDTSAILVGAEYGFAPMTTAPAAASAAGTAHRIVLRGGYFYNQAAAPDENVTPLLPEAARPHVSAGVGVRLGDKLSLDVAYQFIRHDDRRGRVVNPPAGTAPTVALNSGVYRARGDLLGITVTYRP